MSSANNEPGRETGRSATPLDEISFRILELLRDNGRISIAALAEKVGISRANAYTRIEALVADGVITGFSARVDPARAGLSIGAMIFVTVYPQAWASFRAQIDDMPDIEYCAVTTGEHDAMLLIRATDVSGVHEFSTGVIAQLPEVRTVVSVVVLDEVIRRPYVLPTDLPERDFEAPLGMTQWTPATSGRDALPPR
ncbi:Leucine-responsive regulatory protein, regulator for leucine (or lrp) regulon and high-affinity branched-chain amino acid transport system [Microbacterium esteraromaticum]|uniref:Leucine-responsive regulatory protein, regulator for leucine (Or lrp) regulon and high-affinity branched-chain amino acid transport system n=1 Tax=Microbacterium esteraromaticum TaxID=57043 RepID=A0A1R4ILQ2_9MICO|nr:Lrp/AsnC family transcriptional regulator [Microbacterium esteraromaticum]SJN20183.1 Leucine-responsive regulatory protein, regulator for leucine (or lrp) regulon and high-affinity branched-chain amino acid transport system [Microbacterium esteraromaticum]